MAQLASFTPTRPSPPFPLAPLSFSTVYPSYTITSSFPLFTLPPDIWPLVMRFLATSDLRSLAHVDRDCRRLAGLTLWRDLKADFGQGSYDVLKGLIRGSKEGRSQGGKEGEEDSEWRGRARCVRLVHVGPASEPPYTIRERVGLVNTGTQPKTKPPNAKKYLARLLHLLAHPAALPHLYVLEWNLPGLLASEVVRAIRVSRVRHLRLWNVVFGEGFLVGVCGGEETKGEGVEENGNGNGEGKWALDLLAIEGWSTFASASVLVRLLSAVAPTLRQLVWKGHLLGPVLLPPSSEDPDDKNDNADTLPDFPHLRTLVLDRASPDCTLLLHHFLGEKTRVRTLALDSAMPATASFLLTRGYVSSFKAFAWANTRAAEGSEEDVLAFLEENDQLERFEVMSGVDAEWVEGALVPVLSGFTGLTSLKVVFCGSSTPESSLAALASLQTLTTLSISAGPNHPSTPSWHPSHPTLLALLAPLKRLRRLAFTRDTYEVKAHPLAPRREGGGGYYRVRTLPEGVRIEDWLTGPEIEVYRGPGMCLDIGLDEVSPGPSLGVGLGVSSGSGSDGAMAGVHVQPARESHERRRVREAQDELATLAWERWHAAQMRRVVQSYAEAFKRLEWCFVGQLGFGVEDVYDDEPCEPLQERRKIKRRMVFTYSEEEGEERRDPYGTAVERRMGVACWRPT